MCKRLHIGFFSNSPHLVEKHSFTLILQVGARNQRSYFVVNSIGTLALVICYVIGEDPYSAQEYHCFPQGLWIIL
jgi:hypothetical protein